MAWQWSHTAEAYADARANFEGLPADTLAVIAHEWLVHDRAGPDPSVEDFEAIPLPLVDTEVRIDALWERVEALATCDNGGWNAWVCPFGCHTVPFKFEGV